ncbi:MAG: hypothetical protein V4671_01630, partial [Armatimonadota bacterium]
KASLLQKTNKNPLGRRDSGVYGITVFVVPGSFRASTFVALLYQAAAVCPHRKRFPRLSDSSSRYGQVYRFPLFQYEVGYKDTV